MPVTYRTLLKDGILVSSHWHELNWRYTEMQGIRRKLTAGTLRLHAGALAAFLREERAVYQSLSRLMPLVEEREG